MNRYITRGILEDLAAGRAVLVVSASLTEAGAAHAALLEHARTLSGPHMDEYAWSLENGGQWLRDERTKTAATFVSIGSTMTDHATGDVVVLNGWRHLVDRSDVARAKAYGNADRLRALATGRDVVVVN